MSSDIWGRTQNSCATRKSNERNNFSNWTCMLRHLVMVMTSTAHVWNLWSFRWKVWCILWFNTAISSSSFIQEWRFWIFSRQTKSLFRLWEFCCSWLSGVVTISSGEDTTISTIWQAVNASTTCALQIIKFHRSPRYFLRTRSSPRAHLDIQIYNDRGFSDFLVFSHDNEVIAC